MPAHPDKRFTAAYHRLNPAQREAVDAIEGPVMVIAGPGTGKTEVLTLRIANILKKTDTDPGSILALTFTEAAAANLRRRLVSLIGARGYYINVFTFHGFCNSVIQAYPEYFPRLIGGLNLDEVTRAAILEKIIADAKLKHLKPSGNKFYYLKDIAAALSDFKREGIAPAAFRRLILSAERRLKNLKLPAGQLTREQRHLDKNRDLLILYQRYQKELIRLRLYDYEDMILETVRALQTRRSLRLELQETYQYLLVDEHQDTNSSQNRVAELLSSFYDQPNLFVVGDANQAIFRFQGASLENFTYFQNRFREVKVINLNLNYRSAPGVLAAADSLIANNATALRLNQKTVVPADTGPAVSVFACANPDQENLFIAHDLKRRLASGLPPSTLAVLYRDNRDAAPLAAALERLNLTFRIESDSDLLRDPDLARLLTLLEAINDLVDETKLSAALHLDFLGLDPLSVFQVMALRRREFLPSLLRRVNFLADHHVVNPDALAQLSRRLADWHRHGRHEPFLIFFERLLKESGFLEHLLASSSSPSLALSKINAFFDEIKKVAANRPDFRLADFNHWLKLVRSHQLRLSAPVTSHGEAIRLMTAHRAKGLEFAHVYISGAVDGHWGNRRRPRVLRPFGLAAVTGDNDDERRLFYVCLTRARQSVTITYPLFSADGRPLTPSQFISEIKPDARTLVSPVLPPPANAAEHLFGPTAAGPTPDERDWLRALFLERRLSVTALNNYLACPWRFFYQNLLRVPAAKTPAACFGSAVHASLKSFFDYRRRGRPADLKFILSEFRRALKKEELASADFSRLLKRGGEILPRYFAARSPAWHFHVLTELKLNADLDDDIKLTGLLDKIELHSSTPGVVVVVDYKTGAPKSRAEIEGHTKTSTGDYYRQLVFYRLLLLHSGRGLDMSQGVIDFIEPLPSGRFRQEVFTVSDAEVSLLTETIRSVWDEIINLKFWNRFCTDAHCQFCSLRRLVVSNRREHTAS